MATYGFKAVSFTSSLPPSLPPYCSLFSPPDEENNRGLGQRNLSSDSQEHIPWPLFFFKNKNKMWVALIMVSLLHFPGVIISAHKHSCNQPEAPIINIYRLIVLPLVVISGISAREEIRHYLIHWSALRDTALLKVFIFRITSSRDENKNLSNGLYTS